MMMGLWGDTGWPLGQTCRGTALSCRRAGVRVQKQQGRCYAMTETLTYLSRRNLL